MLRIWIELTWCVERRVLSRDEVRAFGACKEASRLDLMTEHGAQCSVKQLKWEGKVHMGIVPSCRWPERMTVKGEEK